MKLLEEKMIAVFEELRLRSEERYKIVYAMYEYAEKNYYPYIRDANTWFNDHGKIQIRNQVHQRKLGC